MKKTIALSLLLILVLSLAACTPVADENLNSYSEAIKSTSIAGAKIEVSFHHTAFDVNIEGEYTVSLNEDGSATVKYWYDELNSDTLDNDADLLERVSDQVAYVAADGTVTGNLDGTVAAAVQCKMDLIPEKIEECKIERGVLTATVKAANTKAVFGVDLGYDATLDMRLDGEAISSYSIRYTTDEGSANIVCTYTNK